MSFTTGCNACICWETAQEEYTHPFNNNVKIADSQQQKTSFEALLLFKNFNTMTINYIPDEKRMLDSETDREILNLPE